MDLVINYLIGFVLCFALYTGAAIIYIKRKKAYYNIEEKEGLLLDIIKEMIIPASLFSWFSLLVVSIIVAIIAIIYIVGTSLKWLGRLLNFIYYKNIKLIDKLLK